LAIFDPTSFRCLFPQGIAATFPQVASDPFETAYLTGSRFLFLSVEKGFHEA
jgi:hypothetical protein